MSDLPLNPSPSPIVTNIKCKACGCNWGIRDLLIPGNANPHSRIICGLCGRELEYING